MADLQAMSRASDTARDQDEWVGDAILVAGAPRSGTTWLAKIFDSHPDVLYRHEPDVITAPPVDLARSAMLPLLRAWATERHLRVAAKQPFFAKSWQAAAARRVRTALAYALRGAALCPPLRRPLAAARLPDLGQIQRARIVVKTVGWGGGIGAVAAALPRSRTVVIMRAPHAQVFSVLRGARHGRFELRTGGDMPLDEDAALVSAAACGVSAAAFQVLPAAAKYAWGWVAFHEAAEHAAAARTNVRLIRYEDLCDATEATARDVLDFAGLAWHPQTDCFVRRSVQGGDSGYYGVFQNPAVTTTRWRTGMSAADQAAVTDVVRHSPVARHWPYLME